MYIPKYKLFNMYNATCMFILIYAYIILRSNAPPLTTFQLLSYLPLFFWKLTHVFPNPMNPLSSASICMCVGSSTFNNHQKYWLASIFSCRIFVGVRVILFS